MVNYAREDTHYLIYIYERMKQDLNSRYCLGDVKNPEMKKGTPKESKDRKPKSKSNQIAPVKEKGVNLLLEVWNKSRSVCLKQYRIPTFDEMFSKFYSNLTKEGKKFNNQQSYALQEIFLWRDRVAREEDESPHFVMTKLVMLNILNQLHNEPENILQSCSRHRFVHQHLPQLHEIIVKAKAITIKSSSVTKKQTNKRNAAASATATAIPPVLRRPMKKRKIKNVASSTVTKARLVHNISEVEMIDLSFGPNQVKERRPAKKINMCKVVLTDLVHKIDAAAAKSSSRNEREPAKKSRKVELIDLT